jgi:hypothetical protein
MADLLDTLRNALEDLVTLEIITAVGQIKHSPAPGESGNPTPSSPDIDWDQGPKVMLTKINLIQGDIKTVLDPSFVTGDYQSVREFHLAREKEGYQMIHQNLAAIKELYALAQEWLGGT